MQRVVKSIETGQFLAPGWKWTSQVDQAWKFRDIAQAIAVASRLAGLEVEVVLMYADVPSEHDLSLAMRTKRPM